MTPPTSDPPLDNEFIISFFRLRQALGAIGIAFPIVLWIGARLVGDLDNIGQPTSVSAYYYTSFRDVFVGSLVAIGVFLFCYRGPDRQDNWLTNIAGACAIGIALFPTGLFEGIMDQCPAILQNRCSGKHLLGIHGYLAAAFFLIISYLATFRFRIPSRPYITKQKKQRNKVYVVCGIVMFLSLATIVVMYRLPGTPSIVVPEVIAIITFGIAWLTKGQAILADKDKDIIATAAA
jgi:hypothetical protein